MKTFSQPKQVKPKQGAPKKKGCGCGKKTKKNQ